MFLNTNKSSSSFTAFTPTRGFYVVLGSIILFFSHLVYSRFSSPSNLPHQVNESVVVPAATTTTTPTRKKQDLRFHHVLAYGDSLTAGVCSRDKSEYTPYAPYLEKALNDTAISDGWKDGSQVEVHHLGLPGWTTTQMLENQNSVGVGLIPFIDAYHEPSPSLVILMAGTNDLGRKDDEGEIIDHLQKIHQLCYDHGVPRTLAIGIPPSGYQARVADVADKTKRINDAIKKFTEGENRATYVEFPFPYESDGEYWCRDTLHFSTTGYEKLGTSLAPYVQEILAKLDDSDATGEGSG